MAVLVPYVVTVLPVRAGPVRELLVLQCLNAYLQVSHGSPVFQL